MRTQRITIREIRDLLNTVDEQFLDSTLMVWGEGRGFVIDELTLADEDYYTDDETAYLESEMNEYFDEETRADMTLAFKKGHPIAWIDCHYKTEQKLDQE